MKCPECGKELTDKDVLCPLFDERGKELGHTHLSKKSYDEVMELCKEYNLDGFHTYYALMVNSFVEAFDKKLTVEKVIEKSALIFMNKLLALK